MEVQCLLEGRHLFEAWLLLEEIQYLHIIPSQYHKFVYIFYLQAYFKFVFSLLRNHWQHISITHTNTHYFSFVMAVDLKEVKSISKQIIKHEISMAFIKHMQDKKSSLLVNISSFNKTKVLSRNQALNKKSSNSKQQKTTPIQFRTKKNNFFRDVCL